VAGGGVGGAALGHADEGGFDDGVNGGAGTFLAGFARHGYSELNPNNYSE
jgi:hypothetical protein